MGLDLSYRYRLLCNIVQEKPVILTTEEYKLKTNNFIHDSQFTILNNNPTQHHKKTIKTNTKTM
jgi:hypothetical protein